MIKGRSSGAIAGVLLALFTAALPGSAQQGQSASDSSAVARTVERFHELIAAGDSLAALALLTDDAVILESGGLETKVQFREHHLAADVRFAQSTKGERRVHSVTQRGDVAWVASTSTATGSFGGRDVNSAGAELMLLVRTPSGWRISAIHWSSRRQRS